MWCQNLKYMLPLPNCMPTLPKHVSITAENDARKAKTDAKMAPNNAKMAGNYVKMPCQIDRKQR